MWLRIDQSEVSIVSYYQGVSYKSDIIVISGLDKGDRKVLQQKYSKHQPPCLLDTSDGRWETALKSLMTFYWPFTDLLLTFCWPFTDLLFTRNLLLTFCWPFSDLLFTRNLILTCVIVSGLCWRVSTITQWRWWMSWAAAEDTDWRESHSREHCPAFTSRMTSRDIVFLNPSILFCFSYMQENAHNMRTSATRVTKELAKSLIRKDSDLSNYHQKFAIIYHMSKDIA